MTSLFATNDYRIGLANNPASSMTPMGAGGILLGRSSRESSRADGKRGSHCRVRRRRRFCSPPTRQPADLLRLANAIPAGNLTVRPKLLEAIGEAFLRHVEEVLCARSTAC